MRDAAWTGHGHRSTCQRLLKSSVHTKASSSSAGAMAARENVDPRSLDVKALQAKLNEEGFDLGGPDRLKELKL